MCRTQEEAGAIDNGNEIAQNLCGRSGGEQTSTANQACGRSIATR